MFCPHSDKNEVTRTVKGLGSLASVRLHTLGSLRATQLARDPVNQQQVSWCSGRIPAKNGPHDRIHHAVGFTWNITSIMGDIFQVPFNALQP